MHEGRAGLVDVGLSGGECGLEGIAAHDQFGAVRTAGLDLCHRRVLRDVDAGRDSGLARRPGDGLSVVAGARATTPACRCSGASGAIRLTAPRTLNAPVRWRFSAFNQTSRPAIREKVSEP